MLCWRRRLQSPELRGGRQFSADSRADSEHAVLRRMCPAHRSRGYRTDIVIGHLVSGSRKDLVRLFLRYDYDIIRWKPPTLVAKQSVPPAGRLLAEHFYNVPTAKRKRRIVWTFI